MESEIWGYIGQAAYTLGGLLIGWLWRSLKVSRKEYALIREGICALLRDRLLYRLEKCIDGGYCFCHLFSRKTAVIHRFSFVAVLMHEVE